MDPLKRDKSRLSSHSGPLIFLPSVITNTEEWGYFKALTKTPTPLEENMFHLEEGTPGPRVYLRPKESVHIPLKYQSFLCDHTMALQVQWRAELDADGTVRTDQPLKPCFRKCWNDEWDCVSAVADVLLEPLKKLGFVLSHCIFPSPEMKDQSYCLQIKQ